MRIFNRLSVQSKLMTMLLAVSISSIMVIAYEGYRSGRNALSRSAVNQLISLRTAKAGQIEGYFFILRNELKVVGRSPSTVKAMKNFAATFKTVLGESKSIDGTTVGSLRQFYKDEFAPRLAENTGINVNSDVFLPASILARYLQYEYIVDNPHEVGKKQKLDDAGDNSKYNKIHQEYHPIFRQIIEDLGYYDLFLIDNEGNIVYSVYKEVDFATSLLIGPHARSGLSQVYKEAQKQNSGYVAIADFSSYQPSYDAPAAFMATPLYDGINLVGVLAVQMPVNRINSVMTNDNNWQQDGLGESGETFIVGADFLMRSNSRPLIESPDEYFEALAQKQVSKESIERIKRLETAVLNQSANSEAVQKALEGESGIETVTNYLGKKTLSAYGPLSIRGVDWVIVSEIGSSELFAPTVTFARRVLISAAGLVFLITLTSFWLARAFLKPVNLLSDGFSRLAKGHQEVSVPVLADDELGELAKSFNHMVKKSHKTSELVSQKSQETEALLLNMFPASVAQRLQKGSTFITDEAESVTVLFANVMNFQQLTESLSPQKAIEILNEIVKALDDATEHHGIEKIKTAGSEYLAVSGLSVARLDHAKRIIDFAVEAIRIVNQVNREWDVNLQLRSGVHSGGVIAGTVGSQRLMYDVWGKTVVTAHAVQSAATPNSIYVTKTVAHSLTDLYEFESEGEVSGHNGERVSILRVNI